MLRLSLVGAFCFTTVAHAQVVNPANGHTYFRTDARVTFIQARVQAWLADGYIVSIQDAAEEQWLNSNFPGDKWIGFSDRRQEGVWLWESGEPVTYTNWSATADSCGGDDCDYAHSAGIEGGWQRSTDLRQHAGKYAIIETESTLGPTLENLSGTISESVFEITWTNPATFDFIHVYRDTSNVATLPGDATSFTFPASEANPVQRFFFWPGGGPLPARPVSYLASYYRLWIEDAEISESSSGPVRILMSNLAALQGYSYGICHDPEVLTPVSVETGSVVDEVMSTSGSLEPGFDFRSVNILADGVTVQVLVELIGPGSTFIPIATDHELDIVTYEVQPGSPATATLDFCEFSSVPSAGPQEVVHYGSGDSFPPIMEAGTVVVTHPSTFRRGDSNNDGSIDIGDPIHNLEYLFYGGQSMCLKAQDTNDDGSVDVADPVYGLEFQFHGGPPPPAPFGECGPDAIVDSLSCEESVCR